MRYKYTKEILEPIIKESKNWAEVCRKIGVKPMGGTQANLKIRAQKFEIDSSHFLGKAWSRGKTNLRRKPLSIWLKSNSTVKSDSLRKRLIKEGIKEPRCEKCGISEWCGHPAPLELDHINSNHFDNRLENLQILCPNCHSIKKLWYIVAE